MGRIESKSGVKCRHIAADGETALDLAMRACRQLFRRHDRDSIDAVIFCTQTPDHVMPSNAFLVHRHMEFRENVFAFDYNLACSGFVYGVAMVHGFLAGGLARRVLLITADTYSKLIHNGDRSARVLFGDGAAATLIGRAEGPGGFFDFDLAASGQYYDRFWVPAGGFRRPRSAETSVEHTDQNGNVSTANDIHMDGMGVWGFINSVVPGQMRALLDRNGKRLDDVDLVLFHQASKMTLDSLVRVLKLRPEQVFSNLEMVGNTVSSSLPILFKDACDQGKLRPGGLVLLSGFGVGLSSAAALMEV